MNSYENELIFLFFPLQLVAVQLKYLVDFDPQLTEIVSETKYMEQLGFSVPELARNVALQVSQTGLHWKTRASILHIHIYLWFGIWFSKCTCQLTNIR